MSKLTRRIITLTVFVLLSLMLGMIVGVWANANFGESFQFDAVSGYEGTGSIGLIIVSVILIFVSAYYWVKGKNTR